MIKDGTVHKYEVRQVSKKQTYRFVLFSSCVVYAKKKKKHEYKYEGALHLGDLLVRPYGESSFQIFLKSGDSSTCWTAENERERDSWVSEVNSAIDRWCKSRLPDNSKKGKLRLTATVDKSGVWSLYDEWGNKVGIPEKHSLRKHTEKKKDAVLWRLTGEERVFMHEVALHSSSLNENFSYIMETSNCIFMWCGKNSSDKSKKRALHISKLVSKEKGKINWAVCKHKIFNYSKKSIDPIFFPANLKKARTNSSEEEFWDRLEGGPSFVSTGGTFSSGESYKFVSVIEFDSVVSVPTVVNSKTVSKQLLDSSKCILTDTIHYLFLWVGDQCSASSVTDAMKKAEDICIKGNRTATKIVFAFEGNESILFRDYFAFL